MCMSVTEEAIIKAIVRINYLMECWGFTDSPIYHVYRFHAYSNCPNKTDPEVAERDKQSVQDYVQRNS